MAGGSREPEHDDDRQCVHCGLWYRAAGVGQHEAHCSLAPHDRRIIDLVDPHALMRAEDVDLDLPALADDPADAIPVDGHRLDEPADPGDGVAADPGGGAGATPPSDPARTDGGAGPAPVPDDWGRDDPADADPGDEPARSTACEACGGRNLKPARAVLAGLDDDDLPDDLPLDEGRVCMDCSTDDGGNLRSPIEVTA